MSLHDKLLALAKSMESGVTGRDIRQSIALAAARLALDEARDKCRKIAEFDYAQKDGLPRIAMGNRCDDCAQEIDALRDSLHARGEG